MSQDREDYEAYDLGEEPPETPTAEEDYYEEDAFSTLGEEDTENPYIRFLKSNAILLGLIGVILIILIVLYQRLPKAPFETIPNSQLVALEERIGQMETLLAQMEETTASGPEAGAAPEQQLDLLNQRVVQVEAFVSKEMESVSERMEALEKKTAAMAKKIETATAPKKVVKKSAPPAPSVKYHTVQDGETLYSIAKKYGMSVDDLKKRNKLSANTIHKGDKLRISP